MRFAHNMNETVVGCCEHACICLKAILKFMDDE